MIANFNNEIDVKGEQKYEIIQIARIYAFRHAFENYKIHICD